MLYDIIQRWGLWEVIRVVLGPKFVALTIALVKWSYKKKQHKIFIFSFLFFSLHPSSSSCKNPGKAT